MYPCDPLPARDQRMSKNPASNSYRPTLPLGILFAEIITAPNAQEHVPSLARHGLNPPSCPLYRWARWGRTVQSQNHRSSPCCTCTRFPLPSKVFEGGSYSLGDLLERHALSLMVRLFPDHKGPQHLLPVVRRVA